MTPTERRQVATLLRRAARFAEDPSEVGSNDNSVWGGIVWFGKRATRDAALREWHRALPRRTEVGIERRVLLALFLAAAIEAGDLP